MSSVTLTTLLASFVGNKRRVSALKALGVVSVYDALTYYPFRVTQPVPVVPFARLQANMSATFAARVCRVQTISMSARRGYRLEVLLSGDPLPSEFDQSYNACHVLGSCESDLLRSVDSGTSAAFYAVVSSVTLVYFSRRKSYVDWLAGRLRVGSHVVVSGDVTEFNARLQLTYPQVVPVFSPELSQPVLRGAGHCGGDFDNSVDNSADKSRGVGVEELSTVEALRRLSVPRPVYHASSRISSDHIHDVIVQVLKELGASLSSIPMIDSEDTLLLPGSSSDSLSTFSVSSQSSSTASSSLLADIVPHDLRSRRALMSRLEAFVQVHMPDSVASFYRALETLRYEEALITQVAVLSSRQSADRAAAFSCGVSSLRTSFASSLDFSLTEGQQEVVGDIVGDMCSAHPMRRLLQGEVGSGKTIVAMMAMLQAVGSGYQAVLVAPTQVLAAQHAQSLRSMIARSGLDVSLTLVTGGMKLAERRRALASVASGDPQIIVATHAAFSASFQPTNLALVVIDEQHRFGVEQRTALLQRVGLCVQDSACDQSIDQLESQHLRVLQRTAHLLVMTATPIPRSAALTWFGDLDVSYLTQLPHGRKPIATFVVDERDARRMASMFAHIRSRIDAGERAYIVCPHICDDSDAADVDMSSSSSQDESMFDDVFVDANDVGVARADGASGGAHCAIDFGAPCPRRHLHTIAGMLQRLRALAQFEGVTFASLSGRDTDDDKRLVMQRFIEGSVQVLVATTVIEVGVDVPQASCIVIFDADRFGLSQLHQLRGRVGRGGGASWAFLVSLAESGSLAEERLRVVEGSLDGAEIARQDLLMRNVGDVLGDRQSGGRSSLKLLRVVQDARLIGDAREDALALLRDDPQLLAYPHLAGAVLDFMRAHEAAVVSN